MESTLKFDKTNLKLRIVFFLVGLLIMALGISIIAISNFGNGPWDAVNLSLIHIFDFDAINASLFVFFIIWLSPIILSSIILYLSLIHISYLIYLKIVLTA